MADDLLTRGAALLAFLLIVGGSTYGAYSAFGIASLEPGGIVVDAEAASVDTVPGGTVTAFFTARGGGSEGLALEVVDAADVTAVVHDAGTEDGASRFAVVVTVPEDAAPGERTLRVRAASGEEGARSARGAVTINVLAPYGAISIEPVESTLAVQAGHTVAAAFVVAHEGPANQSVTLRATDAAGLDADAPDVISVPGRAATGGWVAFTVPEDASPGKRTVTVTAATAKGPDRSATATMTIDVLAPGPGGVELGDSVSVGYVGRLPDGRVFNDNVKAYVDASLARTDFYRASGELNVRTGPNANVLEGFWKGLIGMRTGETRTLTLTPEEAYGPKMIAEEVPATTEIELVFEMPLQPITRPFASFASHVEQTDQGDPAEYGVGDTFLFEQGPNRWTFRITELSADSITYLPAPSVGERFTLPQHATWENASVVESVNDTAIVFHTTPPVDVGESFTFFDYWPDMSAVESVNATHALIRHSPPVGHTFAVDAQGGGPSREYTIVAVEDDVIREAYESPNPLAGETLVFNVRVLKITSDQ